MSLGPILTKVLYNKEKTRFDIILCAILERESVPPQPTQVLDLAKVIKHIQFCSPSGLAPLCLWQMDLGSSARHLQLIKSTHYSNTLSWVYGYFLQNS